MAFDVNKLLRPHIASLLPYSSARDEYSGKEGIFLDANENPLGSITHQDYNRYPDPYQSGLKSMVSVLKSLPENQIFLGNGSDEAIDLLFRAFCNPGIDNVMLLPPTYGMYEVSANINDVPIKKVPLTSDYQLDLPGILKEIDPKTKIIFVCSPNNPTGNIMRRSDILGLLKSFNGLVVVDEAYIDFSPEPSFIKELPDHPNLIVLQTFSKAWGLASLRLGMAFAAPETIAILNKIKPPYNISGLTQQTVMEAMDNLHKVEAMVEQILTDKEELKELLMAAPGVIKVYPSHANFLLVKVTDPKGLYNYLVNQKIIVRDRSKVLLCEGSLRVTVGTREENKTLIKALKSFQPNVEKVK